MRNAFAVYVREIKSYFVSPILYIFAAVFITFIGSTFKDNLFNFSTTAMRLLRYASSYGGDIPIMNISTVVIKVFQYMNFITLLIIPLLTMRLYAEEKKSGTMELLMTSPITTFQVLIGKFLSCLTIYFFMMSLTMAFILIMMVQSNSRLDWGPVYSSYLGTFLLGATAISIGMFFSSLTENQIVAASVSITTLMGLWILVFSARFVNPPLSNLINFLSLSDHIDSFTMGYIGIMHISYYLSMTVFWLFLTGISVESARWRQ